jgi:hypothetical protein
MALSMPSGIRKRIQSDIVHFQNYMKMLVFLRCGKPPRGLAICKIKIQAAARVVNAMQLRDDCLYDYLYALTARRWEEICASPEYQEAERRVEARISKGISRLTAHLLIASNSSLTPV